MFGLWKINDKLEDGSDRYSEKENKDFDEPPFPEGF